MYYELCQCPVCEFPLDLRLQGFSTGLGPPLVQCRCGELVSTTRKEWASFGRSERLKYVGLTLVYVAVIGLLGAGSLVFAVHFLTAGSDLDAMGLLAPGFIPGLVAWVLLLLGLQISRVRASQRRSSAGSAAPFRAGILDMTVALQFKVTALVFLPPLLAWLTSFFWQRSPPP